MTQPFRWAVAGFGWVARDHLAPALPRAGHVLACATDPRPRARSEAAARGARAYQDVVTMLREEEPDALYVATPNAAHLPPVLAATARGVPILCEKPMAATLADAERIAAAVLAAGVLYGTAFDQRHHPAHVASRDAIAAGTIGRVTALRIVYTCWVGPDWSPGPDPGRDNWRTDAHRAGGGAVLDLAPHGLDLAAMLLGETVGALHMLVQHRVQAYAVEDGGLVTGRTASGVLVSLHVAYNTPETLPRRRLEIVGDLGMLTAIDTMGQTAGGTLTCTRASDGRTEALPFDEALSPFAAQATAFAGAVRGAPDHGFCLDRDLALARDFDAAYTRAGQCR